MLDRRSFIGGCVAVGLAAGFSNVGKSEAVSQEIWIDEDAPKALPVVTSIAYHGRKNVQAVGRVHQYRLSYDDGSTLGLMMDSPLPDTALKWIIGQDDSHKFTLGNQPVPAWDLLCYAGSTLRDRWLHVDRHCGGKPTIMPWTLAHAERRNT